jgi:hypothetical protein
MKHFLVRAFYALALASGVMAGAINTAQADLTMPYGTGTTTFAYMNVSGTNATVAITYYDQSGNSVFSTSQPSVPTNQRMNVTVGVAPDGGVPANFTIGSVVLSSDQDLVAAAATDYVGKPAYESGQGTGATAGNEMSMYEAFNAGDTTLYVPYVIRIQQSGTQTATQATRYTIQNTTGSATIVYMTYYTQTGGNLGTMTKPLSPYGSFTIDTAKDSDVPAYFASNAATQASVLVTATQPIVGVVEVSYNNASGKQNWIGDYSAAVPGNATNVIYSPLANRICTPPAQLCGPGLFANHRAFNSFAIQNTENVAANVTARFVGTSNPAGGSGNTRAVDYSFNLTIPPNALYNMNLFNGGDVKGITQTNLFAEGTGLGSAFLGSLTISSTTKVVGIGFYQQPFAIQNYVSLFNMVGGADASAKVEAPWIDRVCTGTCATGSFELWKFTNLTIMNVGAAAATVSSVDFYTATGALQQSFAVNGTGGALTLQPGESFNFNTRTGSSFSTAQTQLLGNSFQGTVVVNGSAGAKLKGLVLIVKGKDSADMYSAFNR